MDSLFPELITPRPVAAPRRAAPVPAPQAPAPTYDDVAEPVQPLPIRVQPAARELVEEMAGRGLVDPGLVPPAAPALTREQAQEQVRAALRAASAAGHTVRGILAPGVLTDDLRDWAFRRQWHQTRSAGRDDAQYVATDSLAETRRWRRYGSVSLLLATARAAEATEPTARPGGCPELRDYQLGALAEVEAHWACGIRSVLLQSVTGSGKSVMIAEAVRRHVEAGGVAVPLAHTKELIDQLHAKIIEGGLPAEDVGRMSSDHRPTPGQRVVVSTVQSAKKLLAHFGEGANLLLIIDECHHALAGMYVRAVEGLKPTRILGASATPMRGDGRGLGEMFEVMVQALSYEEGFARGFLVRPRYFVPTEPDLSQIKITGGDYNEVQTEAVMMEPQIVGSVIEHATKLASDRQIIVFATTVKHSLALLKEFQRAGFAAEHVDGSTPREERNDIFARYRSGDTQVLLNCQIATEGVDVPACGAVVIARPTRSAILWIQMAGRALRPAEGKSDCLVIDHGGSWYDLGPVEAYTNDVWTLEGKKKANKTSNTMSRHDAERSCRCGRRWVGGPRCPSCGAVGGGRNWQAENMAALNAELVEAESKLDPKLQKSRAKARLTDAQREQLYGEMVQYAITSTRTGNPNQAYYWYRDMFGSDPGNQWDRRPRVVTTEGLVLIEAYMDNRRKAWHATRRGEQKAAAKRQPVTKGARR